jgi:hypothetical protein
MTISALEVTILSKGEKSLRELFEVQGHAVFFDVLGVVMADWIPSGQTVSQHYYIEILTKLSE